MRSQALCSSCRRSSGSTEGSPQVPACTTLHRTHIESSATRSPAARARPQPVCTMIHVMICCAFVRGRGQCWQELPLTSSSLPTTSTMASGGQTIIIFSPLPLPPAGALLDGDALLYGRCAPPLTPGPRTHHTLAHARTHARTYARTYARTHARMHARTHARTHAHTHARKHTRTYARTHARTHTHTRSLTRSLTHSLTLSPTH